MSVSSIKAAIEQVNENIKKLDDLKNDIEKVIRRTSNTQSFELAYAEKVYKQLVIENDDISEGDFLMDLENEGEDYLGKFEKLKNEVESVKGGQVEKSKAVQSRINNLESEKNNLEVALRAAEEEEEKARKAAVKAFLGIK